MILSTRLPPGRTNRKARAYAGEIHRLRTEGYSLENIRRMLQEAGIAVSRSTVYREAIRPAPRPAMPAAALPAGAASNTVVAPSPPASPRSPLKGDPRSGKAIAQEFAAGLITNPLLRERFRDEDRRT